MLDRNPINERNQKRIAAIAAWTMPVVLCMAGLSCVQPGGVEIAGGITYPSAPGETPQAAGPVDAPSAEVVLMNSNAQEQTTGALRLDLQAAVLMALKNNASFRVERLEPMVRRTEEEVHRAVFDPTLSLAAGLARSTDDGSTNSVSDVDSASAEIALTQTLPSGTTLEIAAGLETTSTENGGASESETIDWEGTLSQSLLRGFGSRANLVRLRRARLDTEISLYELRGAAESLVAEIERSYWDYILAGRSLEIYERSLEIANREVAEVKERISVGRVAETELAAAEAEMASRREQLIEARGTFAKQRLRLIRLLSPAGGPAIWSRDIELSDAPELSALEVGGVTSHVDAALQQRADLNEARLRVRQNDLEIVRTRNGLLPKLDLFVTLGGSMYANSFSDGNDEDGDTTVYGGGLILEVPLGNRDARARHERARLSLEQTRAALANMEQLVQVDVRSAHVDVERAAERVKATKATLELRKKTLRNEQEEFRVGRSTTFLVSQAQRDMVASQIAEVEAIIGYRKALLDLYRLEGVLLERKGVAIDPGKR